MHGPFVSDPHREFWDIWYQRIHAHSGFFTPLSGVLVLWGLPSSHMAFWVAGPLLVVKLFLWGLGTLKASVPGTKEKL